jgi:phosphosulfolactate synthase
MNEFLDLPQRPNKPRQTGLTCLIDNGVSTQFYSDVLESHSGLVDFVKFGWGTGLVTKDLQKKIDIAHKHNVNYFFGGTLFEKAFLQNKVDAFISYCKNHGAQYVEISDGTVEIPLNQRTELIQKMSEDFKVITEVGYKDGERSQEFHPSQWIKYIESDLKAGATKVITEARESGTSGICRSNGEVRYGLIEEILASGLDLTRIIFEAPNKNLQTYFLRKVGFNVNLGNISFHDVIGLETLRLGLRSDTLSLFEPHL